MKERDLASVEPLQAPPEGELWAREALCVSEGRGRFCVYVDGEVYWKERAEEVSGVSMASSSEGRRKRRKKRKNNAFQDSFPLHIMCHFILDWNGLCLSVEVDAIYKTVCLTGVMMKKKNIITFFSR